MKNLQMLALYIYDAETNKHVATIHGANNAACEGIAQDMFANDFGWTYSPAFGYTDGLEENSDAQVINA